jgi:glycosyltransferase involved in cell wall biosynthesis
MGGPRIVGLVGGEPGTALSGVARHLLDAVDQRFPVVERLDYAPRGLRRLGLAARTFRPSRTAWRAGFHSSLAAHRAHDRTLSERLRGRASTFDLALQVHGWVTGQPRPYTLFVDQTRLMADRGWPGWVRLRPGERGELLALERQMYAEAQHIFVMSQAALTSLMDDYEIDPLRATVVGGGPIFDRVPEPVRPPTNPAILFVGREFERKGGRVLLQAFERVRAQLPDAELHLAGVNRRLALPGVVVHGMVTDRERLAGLYRQARAFCLPSLYEPYGLVLLEAMSHGVPCVGTRVQAIPEILDQGRAGLLVEPDDSPALADTLLALLSDDDLASRVGAAGRSFVARELTWERVADRMAPAIEAAAG